MLKKLIILSVFQLLAVPVFASEETIAKKQSATQQIEKLKEHIPVPELQKIVMEYIGNEYVPKILDQNKRIVKAALSQNGVYLISLSSHSETFFHSKETAKIWKFENGAYKLTHELIIPMMVNYVAISDDGKYIAFEPNVRGIYIWELKNNHYSEIQKIEKNISGNLSAFEFFGYGKMLGRAAHDSINIWKLSDKTNRFVHHSNYNTSAMHDVAFSSDGRYIAAGMQSGSINLWKAFQSNIERFNSFQTSISDPGYAIFKVTFSPDSAKLAAYRYGAELFHMKNGSLESFQIIEEPDVAIASNLKFSPDGRYIALEMFDNPTRFSKIDVWKLNPKSLKYEKSFTITNAKGINLIGFAPNNSVITLHFNPANNNAELTVWENQKEQLEQDTGEKIKSATEHEQMVVTEVD